MTMSVLVAMTVYLSGEGSVSHYQSFRDELLSHCSRRWGIVQFDDMRVPQQLKVLDLTFNTANHVSRQQFAPGDDLEGDLATTRLVNCQFHLAERTLPQYLHRLILVEALHVSGGCRGLHRRLAALSDRAGWRRHRHGGDVGIGRRLSPGGTVTRAIGIVEGWE